MVANDATFWNEALDGEIKVLANNTWELVYLPSSTKHLRCKWVLKKKLRLDGSIEKYKDRLVAKGSTQKEEISLTLIHHVSRISSIRIMIVIVTVRNVIIH